MRQSKTCGEPCAVCDGCLEAHDAEIVRGFASVIARQEARITELGSVMRGILAEEDPDGRRVRFDEARKALAGRKEG